MPKEFNQLEWDAALEDDLRQIVRLAVREDLERQNDWTTVALVDPDRQGTAVVVARQDGVMAGLRALPIMIDEMQAAIELRPYASDGDDVAAGSVVAELTGNARDMLACERPMLNLLGRLSGIASLTRAFVHRVEGTSARIYDTRKTTPGWRRLEKYAVRCGGGHNHRTGLFDAILIKDNHLVLAVEQGLTPAKAVRRARDFLAQVTPASFPGINAERIIIEVEVENLTQLGDVLSECPDIVLLDNMSPDDLKAAVICRQSVAPEVEFEASGGVSLVTVRAIAESGVDRISVGSLTHSSHSVDVALEWLASDKE